MSPSWTRLVFEYRALSTISRAFGVDEICPRASVAGVRGQCTSFRILLRCFRGFKFDKVSAELARFRRHAFQVQDRRDGCPRSSRHDVDYVATNTRRETCQDMRFDVFPRHSFKFYVDREKWFQVKIRSHLGSRAACNHYRA